MTEQIQTDRHEGFAVVTMNKPRRRNALGMESVAGLGAALETLAADPGCRAVVLAGAPPAFCSGSDLKELGGLSIPEMCHHEAETAAMARRIAHLPVPVIAAVEGYALGGGFILATACDAVVTARGAKWGLPEVPNGWIPPWGLQTLLARVGPVKAQQITWGFLEMDGAEAVRLGVADGLAEDGGALAMASDWAARIAALPADAVRSTKRFFSAAIAADAERQDAEANRLFAADCESAEAKATLARFTVPA
ncbi:enoyl-CoA hydratase/isomerase family protein [Paralimibaculum aggregatum]|uniref:Enoyl-CoA hydratase/isomerase family protein n=1 Tax=Paralimibaculum aggregatum TaxID=3036245 RepID=A0ABQ6LSK0_9RHOB|nr:enoyl-CoA hydratase/isomerase family protein [Limibaculum sp. NKW23]GMG85052.1 enoyl-CoA hydratase/isomerase family protein [Limibaculum sp. NKW23]